MKAIKYITVLIVLLILAFLTLGLFNPELSYESRTKVHASVEETFNVFTDVDRMEEWFVGFKSSKMISGEEFEIGSKSLLIFEENGEVMEVTEELVNFKENELYAFTLDSDALTAEVEVRFVSLDSTTTEIVAKTNSVGKNLMWKSMLAMVKSSLKERDQDTYNRLKEVVEGE